MRLLSKSPKATIRKNKTSLFLLPMIGFNYTEDWSKLVQHGFVNAYLGDDQYDLVIEDQLFLLFNPEKFTKEFEWFSEELRTHPLYTYEYDCPDNPYGKVVFVFSILPEYQQNLSFFKKGQYSKFDQKYVNNWFPKFLPDSTISKRWQVFKKDAGLKQTLEEKLGVKLPETAELWDLPTPEEEILNYNPESTNYW